MAADIMSFFPKQFTPDIEQAELLRKIEAAWESADILVIDAPVGSGKSLIAMTIVAWQNCGSLTVPDNVLLNQMLTDFPNTPKLLAKERYMCTRADAAAEHSCVTQSKTQRCMECPMSRDMVRDKMSPIGAYVYYAYHANKRYRDVLIVDEAHKLIPMLREMHTKHIWRAQFKYPDVDPLSPEMKAWVDSRTVGHPGISALKYAQAHPTDTSVIYRTTEDYRGKPSDVIKIVPTLGLGSDYWPEGRVSKIVLMSATLSDIDMHQLATYNKRVVRVEGSSNIPSAQRPLIFENVCDVTMTNQSESYPLLARKIEELMERHQESGVVHLPYGMVEPLRKLLAPNPRLMWHTKESRLDAVDEFIKTPGAVLMASGLYEGVSLNYDKARWQVITKFMFPNKGDKFVDEMCNKWPTWYNWEAIKTFLQAYGRVCRRPDDYGITYSLDSLAFNTWMRYSALYPRWILNSEAVYVMDFSDVSGYRRCVPQMS